MESEVEIFHCGINNIVGENMLAEDRINRILDNFSPVSGECNNAQLRFLACDKDIAGFLNACREEKRTGYSNRYIGSTSAIVKRFLRILRPVLPQD